MKIGKLTINKGCIAIGVVFLVFSLSMLIAIYHLTHSVKLLFCGMIYTISTILCAVVFLIFVRRKLTLFVSAKY